MILCQTNSTGTITPLIAALTVYLYGHMSALLSVSLPT